MRPLTRLIFALLLIGVTLPIAHAQETSSSDKIYPVLEIMAQDQPLQQVRVIVQMSSSGTTASLAPQVAQMGGVLLKELPLIHAFSAVLPAMGVYALSQSPNVRWIALDAPISFMSTNCEACSQAPPLSNTFYASLGIDRLRAEHPNIQGQGIAVAVLDSGISDHPDLRKADGTSRIAAWTNTALGFPAPTDFLGHGTYVAGVIGGSGQTSGGRFAGVAPQVSLVNVKVSNNQGVSYTSDVIEGLQWVLDNREAYGIRVVNLSLRSVIPEPYQVSPLDAAVEQLWMNGVVVVTAAGDQEAGVEPGIVYPPANDPYVITVGALDEKSTGVPNDDSSTPFSVWGATEAGYLKPDIYAPGNNVIGASGGPTTLLAIQQAFAQVDAAHFRMSSSSVAAAIVSGSVALLLQDEPHLTPDQVKFRLQQTARLFGQAPVPNAAQLDVYAMVTENGVDGNANAGVSPSVMSWSPSTTPEWDWILSSAVNWNSAYWTAVNWNSVYGTAVNWNSSNGTAVNWNSSGGPAVNWNSSGGTSVNWNSGRSKSGIGGNSASPVQAQSATQAMPNDLQENTTGQVQQHVKVYLAVMQK